MLKRLLCLLFVLTLLPILPAMAEESSADILTLEDLRLWVDGYKTRAMAAQPHNDPTAPESFSDDGYAFMYDFATLYMDRPEMSEDSQVQAMVIYDSEEADLRGIHVDDAAETVLAAYYTENPNLVGNSEQALLYAVNLMPDGAYIGILHRNGQRIQVIDYSVYEQLPTGGDGYSDAGILYTLTDNNVTAIRAYGLNVRVDIEDVAIELEHAHALAAEMSYSQVPTNLAGTDLERFDSEDMLFAGIDFPSLTAEDAIAAFGAPMDDVWFSDDDGYIRSMQFASCSVVFLYDGMRQNGRVMNMTIDTDLLEGPRSVRVGDTIASVLNRFRHGEGQYEDGVEVLYGNEESGEFGTAEYGMDASAILRYGALADDGSKVVLYLNFEQLYLREILLLVNE